MPTTSFLSFPAEIRNHTYSLTLTIDGAIRPIEKNGDTEGAKLLQLCPQIRSEAEDMYYLFNAFEFNRTQADILEGAPEASRFLAALGDKYFRLLGNPTIRTDRFTVTLGSYGADSGNP